MFYQLDLLALLLAPVLAYLAAALLFSFIEHKEEEHTLHLASATETFPRRS